MPVTSLINNVCNFRRAGTDCRHHAPVLPEQAAGRTRVLFLPHCVGRPHPDLQTVETLRKKHPDLDFEVVDPYTFFRLFKQHYQAGDE